MGGQAMAYDGDRAHCVLFGTPSWPIGETWAWNGDSWKLLAGEQDSPPGRLQPSMAFNPNTGRIVMAGGRNPDYTLATGTWEWDGSRWFKSSESGPSNDDVVLTYDP